MTRARTTAALIALGVFATITLRIWLRMTEDGESLGEAVWGIFRFYTIWTNTLIGVACAAVAFGRHVSAQILSNLLLSIVIVAAVYHALLAQLHAFTGLDALIDTMLHTVIPLAYVGHWVFFVPKSGIRYSDILGWLVLPLVYCIFAMARAQIDGEYPYFFLNLADLGVARTGVNIIGLLLAFAGIGALIVALAKLLARRGRSAEGRKA